MKNKIKTIEDAINSLGENDEAVIEYRKLISIESNDYLLNYQLVIIIAKSLNEGWTPDWDDISEYKYFPWFEMGSSGFRYYDCAHWLTNSNVGSRLCFKSRELAMYAGEQFEQNYKGFMIM